MAGVPQKRTDEIQAAAMRIVAAYGVERFAAVSDRQNWKRINSGFVGQLMQETGVEIRTARQHIARAYRRQRDPDWQPPRRGGKRAGAGRKSSGKRRS